ncbi:hypothetical protein [Liquorilactobacillus satsumensis]|uniref:hypothetical protein n=1 Tax=Liquorilactobacillus satsumensis TaxID=259059 RepID=UPI0039E766C0
MFGQKDWNIYQAKHALRRWDFYEKHIAELTRHQKIEARDFFIRLSYLTDDQRKLLRKLFYGCGNKSSNIKGALSEQEKDLIRKFGEYHEKPADRKENEALVELIGKLKALIEI